MTLPVEVEELCQRKDQQTILLPVGSLYLLPNGQAFRNLFMEANKSVMAYIASCVTKDCFDLSILKSEAVSTTHKVRQSHCISDPNHVDKVASVFDSIMWVHIDCWQQ